MKTTHLLAALFLVASAASTYAQPAPSPTQSPGTAADTSMADGEVRKVDKQAGKVTLRHGPIASLDMPGMTMVFKAAEPQMLDNLKEGQKVRFTAARLNGTITVTRIETAN